MQGLFAASAASVLVPLNIGLVWTGSAALGIAGAAAALGAALASACAWRSILRGGHDAARPSVEPGTTRLTFSESSEADEAEGDCGALLGLPSDLLLGSGFFDRLHVADRVVFLCALSETREGGGARTISLRLRLPRSEGSAAPSNYRSLVLELQCSPQDKGLVCGVLRDNSEVETLRAHLAEAKEEAARLKTDQGRTLATMGHELRTPLNAIIGFAEMLGEESLGGFSDPRQRDYASLIQQSGHHLLTVIEGILDGAMVEAGAYSPICETFRFADVVESTRAMLDMTAKEKGIELSVHLAPSCGAIEGDKRVMRQILVNLASNALKFTPRGGQVSIGGQRVGSRLHFWVRDNGMGIAADDLVRIGQPFVRVGRPAEVEGCGLGLALVKTLVKSQHGSFAIESAPGEGTLVTVALPLELSSAISTSRTIDAKGEDHVAFRKTA